MDSVYLRLVWEQGEAQRLLAMEEQLHRRVKGQNEAVAEVYEANGRSRSGLSDPRVVGALPAHCWSAFLPRPTGAVTSVAQRFPLDHTMSCCRPDRLSPPTTLGFLRVQRGMGITPSLLPAYAKGGRQSPKRLAPGGFLMPIEDRPHARPPHPPACTCWDCNNLRINRLGANPSWPSNLSTKEDDAERFLDLDCEKLQVRRPLLLFTHAMQNPNACGEAGKSTIWIH